MNKSILSSVLVVAFAASLSGCNEHAKYDAAASGRRQSAVA